MFAICPPFSHHHYGDDVAYLLYIGLAQTQEEYQARKPAWMAIRYQDRDDALGRAAREIELGAQIPWEIVGDDGSTIGRAEIAEIIHLRRHELRDRPKVY